MNMEDKEMFDQVLFLLAKEYSKVLNEEEDDDEKLKIRKIITCLAMVAGDMKDRF